MGVYNRLMKMPEHCKYCEWVRVDWDNIHFDGNGTVYCAPLFEPIPNDGRHKDCPLVEVKTPHGRLIDADAEYKALSEMKVEGEVFVTAVEFAKIEMEQAQTVIEAEESE